MPSSGPPFDYAQDKLQRESRNVKHRPVVIPSGFRVAAYGLARNDGLVVFVIPAKAGIQGMWQRLNIFRRVGFSQ